MFRKIALAAVAAASFIAPAHAALVVDIKAAFNGTSVWTFSGTDIAGAAGFFDDSNNLNFVDAWLDLGNFTTVQDLEVTNIVGNAMLSIGSETRNIDLAFIDNDNGNRDDFGVGVDGSGNFTFEIGDLVGWTGSIIVDGIGANELGASGLPMTFTSSNYGGVENALDLVVNIQTVPLPAGLPLMMAGLGALGLLGRRKSA